MTYIIAEAGISHNGNMDYARKSIEIAKECGVDIWKTQLYNPESLFPAHEVIVDGRNWYPEVVKCELSLEQTSMLKKHCDKTGIEFMGSAFDFERLQWLEDIGVKRHKIASPMNKNNDYIEKVKSTGKEVLISVNKRRYYLSELIQLYCIPKYPTDIKDINFDDMSQCEGFSDHSQGIEASVFALANCYNKEQFFIEKHFTLDRKEPGCDQIISIEPDELKMLVKFARKFEEINR